MSCSSCCHCVQQNGEIIRIFLFPERINEPTDEELISAAAEGLSTSIRPVREKRHHCPCEMIPIAPQSWKPFSLESGPFPIARNHYYGPRGQLEPEGNNTRYLPELDYEELDGFRMVDRIRIR